MRDAADIRNAFGEVLKETRLKQGLSQEQLAFDAGLDRTFISMMERGLRQPSLSTLFAIAVPLGASPSSLLTEVEKSL